MSSSFKRKIVVLFVLQGEKIKKKNQSNPKIKRLKKKSSCGLALKKATC